MTFPDTLIPERRFFGRRLGQAFSDRKKNIYQNAGDILLPSAVDIKNNPLEKIFPVQTNAYHLEIGFGGGEHLLHRAILHPDISFIGCDAFLSGVANVIETIKNHNINNIRICDYDALYLIQSLPDNAINVLYLLYPDPWPKNRHRKRRFIQKDTITEISRILKPDGVWYFASDIPAYIEWVFAKVHENGSLTLNHNYHYNIPFDDWVSTRYEQKAVKEGRYPHYFIFVKKP